MINLANLNCLLNIFTTDAEFDRIYNFLDADASRELDFDEFQVRHRAKQLPRSFLTTYRSRK